MAYKASPEISTSQELFKTFIEEFEANFNGSPRDYRAAPTYFRLPKEWRNSKSMTTDPPSGDSYRIYQIYDWLSIAAETSNYETAVKNIALRAVGAYTAMIALARQMYGDDCGVADWRDNIELHVRNWEPSVNDPARLISATVAFNFRFVACKRQHIPKKRISINELMEIVGPGMMTPSASVEWSKLVEAINKFFA